ncbi:MAG: hypothetical protein Q8941_21570 [Bacteroidota bacterium]|nr:hypothetical protein [Bacteroidota bacterium]
MTEREWVKTIIDDIEKSLQKSDKTIRVADLKKLPYSFEILMYNNNEPHQQNVNHYETDILVYEQVDESRWKPRIIIESKLGSLTTHDAITYSQKAQTHKNVHPYLRYGILIGNRKHYPLPGFLFRHGQHFDFMLSWQTHKPDKKEFKTLSTVIQDEIKASRALDEIMFNSRTRNRKKYTFLHRPLRLT